VVDTQGKIDSSSVADFIKLKARVAFFKEDHKVRNFMRIIRETPINFNQCWPLIAH